MATKARNFPIVRARSATIAKSRFTSLQERSRAVQKRLREAAQEDTDAAIGLATAVGLGIYEKSGRQLPTVMGLDPALVGGFVIWGLTRKSKSKAAGMARAAGLALATIGANRSTMRGSMRVGEDDTETDDSDDGI